MNWTLWWVFVPTEFALCLTPGPAVLLILASSIRFGARPSLASCLGIVAANTFYFALSATGLGALLASSAQALLWIKWLGAGYLVILGVRSMAGHTSVAPRTGENRDSWLLLRQAFAVQISNPKSIIFFAALLPQFLDTRFPVPRQVAILAVTSAVIEFSVLAGYAFTAGTTLRVAHQPRYAAWTNRAAGAVLIAAAAGLLFLRPGHSI